VNRSFRSKGGRGETDKSETRFETDINGARITREKERERERKRERLGGGELGGKRGQKERGLETVRGGI